MPEDWQERQDITLDLAEEFLKQHTDRKCRFHPVGVTQGWSPRSYANVRRSTAEDGLPVHRPGRDGVPQEQDILACLNAVAEVRHPETRLHLFGVTRCEHINAFSAYGVASFDSTSPLRQAFKHDRENYYTAETFYAAVRVPQVEGNNKLQTTDRLRGGQAGRGETRLEQACLKALKASTARARAWRRAC